MSILTCLGLCASREGILITFLSEPNIYLADHVKKVGNINESKLNMFWLVNKQVTNLIELNVYVLELNFIWSN